MQATKAEELSRTLAYTTLLTTAIETCPKALMVRDIAQMAMKRYEDSDGAIPLKLLAIRPWDVSLNSILEVSSTNS
jgi:hypothetical protein